MKPLGIAERLFKDTAYDRPHEPLTPATRERWARVEALQAELCAAPPGQAAGLVSELTQALELYHALEKQDAFILGFKAGGQAMRQMLEP